MSKVVHLITLLELGGAQGNTIYTVQKIDPARYQAYLWCGKGAYWDENITKAINPRQLRFIRHLVRPIRPLRDFLAFLELTRALQDLKPDILHTHSSKAGILGRLAGRAAGVPIIIHTFHGFGFTPQQPFWIRLLYVYLEKLCAKFSEKLIFVSKSNWETARELGIGSESQYELIRSGVHIELIEQKAQRSNRAEVRHGLGIPELAKVIVTIGPFKPQKNLGDFLKVAEIVIAERPDAVFLMIGDGGLRKELGRQRQELGLNGKVFMPGWRQDIPEILKASDVFLLTSLWEGLPRALVEAMIVEVPSVCYATDGVMDILSNENGFLIPQKDFKKAADAVLRLLENESQAREMASNARTQIGKNFDINEMVRQQERLYDTLLEK